MNTERPEQSDLCRREALLRLACEERSLAEASPELQAELAASPDARADFEQTRALLGQLRQALRPTPLSGSAFQKICRRLDAMRGAGPASGVRVYRVVGLAAAATVALAALGPWALPRGAPEAVDLTGEDAAAIAAACRRPVWSGEIDFQLQRVAEELDGIERQIERKAGAGSYVPWGADDDWDVPGEGRGGTGATPSWPGGPDCRLARGSEESFAPTGVTVRGRSGEEHSSQPTSAVG